jgi:hypothetical protein
MGIEDIIAFAGKLTLGAALVITLVAGYYRVWVWGYQLKDCERRSEQWREIALHGLQVTKRAIDIVSTEEP